MTLLRLFRSTLSLSCWRTAILWHLLKLARISPFLSGSPCASCAVGDPITIISTVSNVNTGSLQHVEVENARVSPVSCSLLFSPACVQSELGIFSDLLKIWQSGWQTTAGLCLLTDPSSTRCTGGLSPSLSLDGCYNKAVLSEIAETLLGFIFLSCLSAPSDSG